MSRYVGRYCIILCSHNFNFKITVIIVLSTIIVVTNVRRNRSLSTNTVIVEIIYVNHGCARFIDIIIIRHKVVNLHGDTQYDVRIYISHIQHTAFVNRFIREKENSKTGLGISEPWVYRPSRRLMPGIKYCLPTVSAKYRSDTRDPPI